MADDDEPEFDANTAGKLYTTADLSEMFQVTRWTIRQWVTKGKLKCVKIDHRLYFTEQHLKDYSQKRWG